jgi:hypothetical protein
MEKTRFFVGGSITLMVLLLLVARPATAAKPGQTTSTSAAQFGFFTVDNFGKVETYSLDRLLASTATGGAPCNGGSNCNPPLNYPTSGGPTCTSGQVCACVCITLADKPAAVNLCAIAPPPDPEPGEPSPDEGH